MGVVTGELKNPGDPANALITPAEYSETIRILGGGPTPATLTIVNGVLTLPTNAYGSGAGIYYVETQGGAGTDDLDTINGSMNNDYIELWAVNAAHQVTFRHAIGNLRMQGGQTFTLNSLGDHVAIRNRAGVLYGKGFNIP